MPSPRDLARLQALGRVVLGTALTVTPRRATTPWLGARAAARTPTAVTASAMGARDVALGLGQVNAIAAGHGARPWIAAGVLADAVDLAATWRARGELPATGVAGLLAVAGGSVALGVWLRTQLD